MCAGARAHPLAVSRTTSWRCCRPPYTFARRRLVGLHRLLAAVSNNVNQVAKATNATGEVQDEVVETLRAVRRLAERIDASIDGLSRP